MKDILSNITTYFVKSNVELTNLAFCRKILLCSSIYRKRVFNLQEFNCKIIMRKQVVNVNLELLRCRYIKI